MRLPILQDPFHSKTYDPFNRNPSQWDVDQARRTAQNESQLVSQERRRQLDSKTSGEWFDSVHRAQEHQSHQWQAENDARMLEDRMWDNRIQEENRRESLRRAREQAEDMEKRRRDAENVARDDAWHSDNTQQRYDVNRAPYVVPMPVRKESAREREARERAAQRAQKSAQAEAERKEKEEKGWWAYTHYDEILAQRARNRAIQAQQELEFQRKRLQLAKEEAELKAMLRREQSGKNRPKAAPGSVSSGKASLEERRKAAGMNPDGTINHNLWR